MRDEAYDAALSELASGTGGTLTLAARDFLNELLRAKDPAEVLRLWTEHPELRDELAKQHPDVIGNLDGIPYDVRAAANLKRLTALHGSELGEPFRSQIDAIWKETMAEVTEFDSDGGVDAGGQRPWRNARARRSRRRQRNIVSEDMSARRMNHVMTAMVVGLVLTMTGCIELVSNDGRAPSGDALFQAASDRYHAYAPGMHEVLMAVHEGEWQVDQGAYGADPSSCQIDADEFGYSFDYARTVTIPDANADAMVDAAVAAFDRIGLAATVATFGSGDVEERNVIAEGDRVGRAVVTIRPATGRVRVTARSQCVPGSASELSIMVFGGDDSLDVWQRVPATEGPASVPQFYFPVDSPVYFNADGTPVDPQPVITEIPNAPYGE